MVDGKALPLAEPADVEVKQSLEIQWARLEPVFQALVHKTGLADPEQSKQDS